MATILNNYIERDISWMYFNARILQEAQRPEVPLLERLSFMGIYSNNLDEFFRVRIAALNRVIEFGGDKHDKLRAKETLKQINRLNKRYAKQFEEAETALREDLRREHIHILDESDIDDERQAFIYNYYQDKLNGYVTPIWFDAFKKINAQTDEGIYLVVKMLHHNPSRKNPERSYALIDIPVAACGRFVRLPDRDGNACLMYLDDVIRRCLPYVFVGGGFTDYQAYSFKFTKDAEMEIDSDLRAGVMQRISKGVNSRKNGSPIRVIYDEQMPRDVVKQVMQKLDVDKLDAIIPSGRYQNHKDFMKFPDCGRKDLKYPEWKPIHKAEFENHSMLELVRDHDRYIHVPYHSFDSYIQLLREAALNKEVRSIKTTLYRLARESKVVKALICAARNGKKVTVVIELLARFDEASNIDWSKRMEEAGINVVFGVDGLKIHSKITHITARSGNIAVISTGNFHEGNARCYTDYMLMTAQKSIVADVERVFSFIEKPYMPTRFKELLVSPNEMRKKVVRLIDQEIKSQQQGKPAYIYLKINHITDPQIVGKLYEAAACGVRIRALVRGNCSMVIDSETPNIEIHGIIDRYLEHSRILIFANGGSPKYYIGSADWMPRNLDCRIEVMTPVYDPAIQADLRRVVDFGFHDSSQGRVVDGTELNTLVAAPEGEQPFRSQLALYEHYCKAEGIEVGE